MNLTIAEATPLVGFVVAILGLWWRVETRISAGAVKAQAKAEQVEKDLNEFKLTVAKEYAPNGWVKDVESRMVTRFDQIMDELHGIREDFKEVVMNRQSKTRGRT